MYTLSSVSITYIDSSTAGCSVLYTLAPPTDTPTSTHHVLATYMDHTWCCQGDHTGRSKFIIIKQTCIIACLYVYRLYLWNIQRLRQEPPLSHSNIPIPPDAHACVSDSWQAPALPCGLTDMLVCKDILQY